MMDQTKEDTFLKIETVHGTSFNCTICRRSFSSKRYVLHHLHTTHDFSPVKRKKKRYVDDPTIPIPQRTQFRWKKHEAAFQSGEGSQVSSHPADTTLNYSETDLDELASGNPLDLDETPGGSRGNTLDLHGTPGGSQGNTLDSDGAPGGSQGNPLNSDGTVCSDSLQSSLLLLGDSFGIESESDSDSVIETESSSCDSSLEEDDEARFVEDNSRNLPENEKQALSLLSCFLRNKMTGSACRDVLDTFQKIFPSYEGVQNLSYDDMWKFAQVCGAPSKEFHYCEKCEEVFPDNPDISSCSTQGCGGVRYKGGQAGGRRQPRQRFVLADVKKQLQLLLESPGVWDDIQANKKAALFSSSTIQDITNGSGYQELLRPGGFLVAPNSISAIMNTDGVNLYSASKVDLWPIFLAINELSPRARFARENIVLAGVWQGKGKPPFKSYLETFSNEMNVLKGDGVNITIGGELFTVKLAVLCTTLDLPAKASVVNMTFFNGAHSCITCEEPGVTVKQGKGHARCFPFRDEPFPERTSEVVRQNMEHATDAARIKGMRGASGLLPLEGFDLVWGVVPDYMHGLLLGITKTLLSKWLSSTQSGQPYFIGKRMKDISKRLEKIRPPHFIERLPRDLEKHYQHLKATELQAWLLYYGIPCLTGILPENYLQHFALLSEATFILLGDSISEEAVDKAKRHLNKFYAQFRPLYGPGSCGLNIHNAGSHLVQYVLRWGPLWAWSCFSFEDANAMLLKSVHGTGDVASQVMRVKLAQAVGRKNGNNETEKKMWVNVKPQLNCSVVGKSKNLTANNMAVLVDKLQFMGVDNADEVLKVDRIIKDGNKFFSIDYSRMKKRDCSFVLFESGFGRVLFFALHANTVFAVVKLFKSAGGHPCTAGEHLLHVRESDHTVCVPAEQLTETLLFMESSDREGFISRMANKHGHSVFK